MSKGYECNYINECDTYCIYDLESKLNGCCDRCKLDYWSKNLIYNYLLFLSFVTK